MLCSDTSINIRPFFSCSRPFVVSTHLLRARWHSDNSPTQKRSAVQCWCHMMFPCQNERASPINYQYSNMFFVLQQHLQVLFYFVLRPLTPCTQIVFSQVLWKPPRYVGTKVLPPDILASCSSTFCKLPDTVLFLFLATKKTRKRKIWKVKKGEEGVCVLSGSSSVSMAGYLGMVCLESRTDSVS